MRRKHRRATYDLCDRFEEMGADVVRVPVDRWSMPTDTAPAERLIRATIERRVDALNFTAKPAVDNFLEIADFLGVGNQLANALAVDVDCSATVRSAPLD